MHTCERMHVSVRVCGCTPVCTSATPGWACVHTEEKDLDCVATCGISPPHEPQTFHYAFSLMHQLSHFCLDENYGSLRHC